MQDRLNEDILEFGIEMKKVLGEIRRYKSENNLSMKAEIRSFKILAQAKHMNYFIKEFNDIKACGGINCLEIERIM